MTNWEADNMVFHLCALSLYIDGYSTDTTDLLQDLNLVPTKMVNYFMELGCKIGGMKLKDRELLGLKSSDSKARKMARLEIPLEFPKQKGARKARR
jgi:DNA-directed RNA polymerase I subunit RPA49